MVCTRWRQVGDQAPCRCRLPRTRMLAWSDTSARQPDQRLPRACAGRSAIHLQVL